MVATAYQKYQLLLTEKMDKAFQQGREIRKAASYISTTLIKKGWIYACGTGHSGRNSVPIELASFAKQKGAKVIVITNLAHSKSVSSRHSSGLKLYQLGNVVLDNFGEIGDSALHLEGLNTAVGPTSTVIGTALLQAVCVEATAQLLAQGIVPDIFASSNSDQGGAHNDALLEAYKPLVKML